MSLLLDENLSSRVKKEINNVFPNTIHVRDDSLEKANDQEIWNYAKENNLTIVSKDSDFHHKSLVFGSPPKVIWLTIGNCSTTDIINLLHEKVNIINSFIEDRESSFLIL